MTFQSCRSMVCAPKCNGGLGVIDIEKQNKALILKNCHKFFNREDLPWANLIWKKHYRNGKLPNHTKKGSFWWGDILKLLNDFKSLANPQIKNGQSILFWHDNWDRQPLSVSAPELHSFANYTHIAAYKAFQAESLTELLQLPISQQAFGQLQEVQQKIQNHPLSDDNDRWVYSWGSGIFSSAKVYKILCGQVESMSTKAQSVLLASSKRQTKHQKSFKKKGHGVGFI